MRTGGVADDGSLNILRLQIWKSAVAQRSSPIKNDCSARTELGGYSSQQRRTSSCP
jgi:hypothetical protein